MKKKFSALVPAILLIWCGCSGAPKAREGTPPLQEELSAVSISVPVTVLEHKNSPKGEDIPAWFFMDPAAITELSEFQGTYAFVFGRIGPDLVKLVDWTRSFPANREIAGRIAEEVMGLFEDSPLEDKELLRPYMEEAAKVLDVAEYSGMRRWADYWVYQEAEEGDEAGMDKFYHYQLLYTVPAEQIYAAVELAFGYADREHPLSAKEQKKAHIRLMEYFDGLKK